MHLDAIAILFHPGDFSFGEWGGLLGMFAAFIVLPLAIIGFIILKIVNGHWSDNDSNESQESIPLGLNESKRE